MSTSKWITVLLAVVLLLQPLACCKRVPVVTGGQTCAADEEQILYVTLMDGRQYELVDWDIESEWVTGQRHMVKVTMNKDGTVDEEEYLEPTRFKLADVADLDLEEVDCRSLWLVGAIVGGVAGGFAGIAAIRGSGGGSGGGVSQDPGPIGTK